MSSKSLWANTTLGNNITLGMPGLIKGEDTQQNGDYASSKLATQNCLFLSSLENQLDSIC